MIIKKGDTDPESRRGFICYGKCNTDSNGVGTITVKGKDYSANITGFSFSCVETASAVKMFAAFVVSIAYVAATSLTTITIQANSIIDTGSGTTDLAAHDGDVYYNFFVSEHALPTDLSTNNTLAQGGL